MKLVQRPQASGPQAAQQAFARQLPQLAHAVNADALQRFAPGLGPGQGGNRQGCQPRRKIGAVQAGRGVTDLGQQGGGGACRGNADTGLHVGLDQHAAQLIAQRLQTAKQALAGANLDPDAGLRHGMGFGDFQPLGDHRAADAIGHGGAAGQQCLFGLRLP